MPQSFSNQSDFIPFFNNDPSAKLSMPQSYNSSRHRGPRYYEPDVCSSRENSYGSPRNHEYHHKHVRAAGICPRPYPSSDSQDKRHHLRSCSMSPQQSERSKRSDEHIHRPSLAIPKTVDDVLNIIDMASKDSNHLDAKKVIIIDDPKILLDWDELPNMLKYLAQSTKRLYGVPFERNQLIVRGLHGAMMFLSRVPLGDGTECPTSLDLMFLYICSYVTAFPGHYLELLSKENYGIAKGKVAQKRFPYTDPTDFTDINIAKFFADQGKLPCDFDDGFVWAIAFAKRMAFDSNIPPEQSIHFFNIHKAGL
ncbi:hypothetical protein C8J56DRAFT_1066886 [Mycena floridula]|nr:hypothetical protein C8J56DRAFT_1066886 [Mycena floridula]